jgi:Ni,Fe-hydrogenase III large subunit/Ni,Fe-hydrogenase III component G
MRFKILKEQYIASRYQTLATGNVISYLVSAVDIAAVCTELYRRHGLQLVTITAADERTEKGCFSIRYIFGVPGQNVFLAPYITLTADETFPSLAKELYEASGYERKIRTFFGLEPSGHPDPRPMILHENWPAGIFPLRHDVDWRKRPPTARGDYSFQRVAGEGIYEIPVGPVHAGIIEPGHFRFSVAGEEILLLEARLGYTHKGSEKLFEILSLPDKLKLSERVSGDTSFTHSLAFCQAVETLAAMPVPRRSQYLRVIFSELERLANHLNDIGFVMLDAGYNFGGAAGARLREGVMQWNERLTGSRFLRGVNAIGGVTCDIDASAVALLTDGLKKLRRDFNEVIEIAEGSASLLNRLVSTGALKHEVALDYGVIGVAGRALGIKRDARLDCPYAAYPDLPFNLAVEKAGDVHARWRVRIKEVQSSLSIIAQALAQLPAGELRAAAIPDVLPADQCAVGMAEGWRGAIAYVILTNAAGQMHRVDVRDPSFLNWAALGHAGPGNIVPDFPLINKSFNLSYSGNDL